ncbi:MAG TPA: hypothetical protein VIH67_13200 [Candidatus Acidoferrum sp.]
MKPAMAVRAERVVAMPPYVQWFGAVRARGRPSGTAFRTFLEQRFRATKWLSYFLQIKDKAARGIAANKEVFHGQGSFIARIVNINVYIRQYH